MRFRRSRAGALNRTLLGLIGLILLLGGLAGITVAYGWWQPLTERIGWSLGAPAAGEPVAPMSVTTVAAASWFGWALAGAGLLLAVLAVAWLIALRPGSPSASTLRLSDDLTAGLTSCEPGVLARMVETELAEIPGVHDAVALIQGSASAPELVLRVELEPDAVLADVLYAIQDRVAADVAVAVDTALHRLAVQFEYASARSTRDTITV